MEGSSASALAIVNSFLTFLTENIWPLVLIVFLFICKDALSDLIRRLTNLRFRKGKTQLDLEAPTSSLLQKPLDSQSIEEKPPAKDAKSTEISEKEASESEWFSEMHLAFSERRIDDAKSIFNSYSQKEPNHEEREQNESFYLYLLYTKGRDISAVSRLERLVQTVSSEKSKMDGLIWLSFCYNDSNDHEKEINLWRNALKEVAGSHHKTQCIEYLSYALKADGKSQEGLIHLENRFQEVSSAEEKVIIFKAISSIEKDLGNDFMNALCLEKIVEFKPDDTDNLFGAAFAQSKAEMRPLSMCNYKTLIKLDPNNSMALNNIGVCASEYELETKAFEYYYEANNNGNSLAMANLGFKLLKVGFYKDAEKIAKEAIKIENPHKNVYSLLARIEEIKNNHSEKWSSLEKKARIFQKNIRKYVHAYYTRTFKQHPFKGLWFTENGIEIDVSMRDGKIEANWIEKSGLFLETEYDLSLSGTFINSSAALRYVKKISNPSQSTLLGSNYSKDVACLSYIYLEDASWFIFSKNLEDEFNLMLCKTPPNKANSRANVNP